jgi:glyoxylase-like metal-dependent hydrolase (beta-lactamase superfamily II)
MNRMSVPAATAPYRPDYAFDAAPAPGPVTEVADGVLWLRMPLPFALDHINLWALADGDGWTLVDTGINRDETKELWRDLFAGPLAGRPAGRLICTHFHPDHFGLAGWLCGEHGIGLTMTRAEWTMGTMIRLDTEGAFSRSMADFYRGHGLGEEWTGPLAARGNMYATRVDLPPNSYLRIVDGDEIDIGGRVWRVIVGTGHAPEHACLYCADLGVLISGDQVLPRITSNVSVWASEPDADPLADFLGSLDRFRGLPEDTLVLPSHGLPFRGLDGRLDDLARHHDDRLAEVAEACPDWRSAADIVPVLFRRELDGHQMTFAMGESIAHLAYLEAQGRLASGRGDDGIMRYRVAT